MKVITQSEKIEYILNIIDKVDFDRMIDYQLEYQSDNNNKIFIDENGKYNKEIFINHNKTCLKELNNEELSFVYKLSKKINKINMVDEENFIEWQCHILYYNSNKKLVIGHFR